MTAQPVSAPLARLAAAVQSAPAALRRAAFIIRTGLQTFPEVLHRSEIDSDGTAARFTFYVNGVRYRATIEPDQAPRKDS
jgi:hypothetical protein